MARWFLLVPVALIALALAYAVQRESRGRSSAPSERRVVVPQLSPQAQEGQRAFDQYCARCHGAHAAGSAQGPPLVDPVYRPSHHADVAFTLAVRRGVRGHHSLFGDMPAQPAVTNSDLANIIRYVRELQKANGID